MPKTRPRKKDTGLFWSRQKPEPGKTKLFETAKKLCILAERDGSIGARRFYDGVKYLYDYGKRERRKLNPATWYVPYQDAIKLMRTVGLKPSDLTRKVVDEAERLDRLWDHDLKRRVDQLNGKLEEVDVFSHKDREKVPVDFLVDSELKKYEKKRNKSRQSNRLDNVVSEKSNGGSKMAAVKKRKPVTVLASEAREMMRELGYKTSANWPIGELEKKLTNLAKKAAEDADAGECQELFDQLYAASASGVRIEVTDDAEPDEDEDTEEMEAEDDEDETEDVEDDDESDVEDSDDEETEDEDEEEEEEVAVKTKKAKAGKKGAKASTNGKAKSVKAAKVQKGPGVLATIAEILCEASESKPLTKDKIAAKLAKKFPNRDADHLEHTVGVQVPTRIQSQGIICYVDEERPRGYWGEEGTAKAKPAKSAKTAKLAKKAKKSKVVEDDDEDDED